MSKPTTKFAVCSVMHEPVFVVKTFVHHYLALGADYVLILWDGVPDEPLQAELTAIAPPDRLKIQFCDTDFWNSLGIDKETVALDDILEAGFAYGYAQCSSDWMLFCDADEILCPADTVSNLLGRVPPDVKSVRVRNLEAVWGPQDDMSKPFGCTYFRSAIEVPRLTRLLTWAMLGKYSVFSRGGVMGHMSGKHFLRTGLSDVTITSHKSLQNNKPFGTFAHHLPDPDEKTFFAHFDAISESRWIEKWQRRISKERISDKMSPQRAAQQALVEQAISNGSAGQLFSRLYGLTRTQTTLLTRLGLIRRHQTAIRKHGA